MEMSMEMFACLLYCAKKNTKGLTQSERDNVYETCQVCIFLNCVKNIPNLYTWFIKGCTSACTVLCFQVKGSWFPWPIQTVLSKEANSGKSVLFNAFEMYQSCSLFSQLPIRVNSYTYFFIPLHKSTPSVHVCRSKVHVWLPQGF